MNATTIDQGMQTEYRPATRRQETDLVRASQNQAMQPLTDDGPEQYDIVDLDDAAFADPTSVSRYARAC
jgi:hypothetical protein